MIRIRVVVSNWMGVSRVGCILDRCEGRKVDIRERWGGWVRPRRESAFFWMAIVRVHGVVIPIILYQRETRVEIVIP